MAWSEVVRGFADPVDASRIDPDPAAMAAYDELLPAYEAFEREACPGV